MLDIEKYIKILQSTEKRTAYLSGLIAIPLLLIGILMIRAGKYIGFLIIAGGLSFIYIFKSTFSRKSKIRIDNEGVYVGDRFIAWHDITTIFIEAEKGTINFIPSSETKHISLFSNFGNRIDLIFSVWGRMSRKTVNAYNRVYETIIEKTAERQLNSFLDSLRCGRFVDFNLLVIRSDGILLKEYKNGKQLLKTNQIQDYYFYRGSLYLTFIDEKRKSINCKIGEIAFIPNIHIIQYFLNLIIKDNK